MSVSARARRGLAALTHPRLRKRLGIILTNSANSLLVPLFNPVVSALVVRLASVALWGDYVRVLVVAQLVSHVVGWGNKDFVLREFARSPAGLAGAWQTSLLTRLPLLLGAALVLAGLGYDPARWLLLVVLAAVLTLAQSFEVFVLYRRDFTFGLGVEVLTVALLAAPIVALRQALTVDGLLLIFIVANAVETVVYALRYRAEVGKRLLGRFELGWLRRAGPFFLLGFSGLLQSRAALYAVTANLPGEEVGHFQIYTNQMIYVQSVSAFVLAPFVKSLYRLNFRTIVGLAFKLGLVGLTAVAVGLPVAALGLHYIYGLDFAPAYYLAGAVFILPLYIYAPIIYAFFKVDKAMWVVVANALGIGLSLVLTLGWLPTYGALGAAWAAAVAQVALLLLYVGWSLRLRRDAATSALPERP